jgi:uncharacterized protein
MAATLIQRVARVPAQLLIALVRGYRFFLSPWLGSSCRFEPSCSAYSLQALGQHGAVAGSYLTLHRLVRCGPWCAGGHDPVPEQMPSLFSRLVAAPHTSTRSTSTLDKTTP